MLKTQHPTDYLKKESIAEPIEEEHHTEIKEFPKLKRYRRSDSDDEREQNTELFSAIRNGNLHKVQELLIAGVKTNIVDKNNKDNTPLHYAVERDKKEIVEELLLQEWKTDINAKNNKGDTPLHIATSKGNKELVQLLLSKHAQIDLENNEGKTPLALAKDSEIISTLEKYYKLSLNEGSFTKINVPADGSCLFWAAALAYLTPVKYDDNSFQERFEKLFGSVDSEELEQIQELIKSYNPSSNNVAIRDDETIRRLVTEEFRNRVVNEIFNNKQKYLDTISINDIFGSRNTDYINRFIDNFSNRFKREIVQYRIDINKLKSTREDEVNNELSKVNDPEFDNVDLKQFIFDSYIECMRDSKAWGGNHEIQAMSQMLHSSTVVFSDGTKHSISYDNSNDQVQLFNNGESHYNFGLVRAQALIEAIKNNKQQEAKAYLNLGIDNINYQDSEGWTALHFAAQHGNAEVTQLLLAQGVRTDVKNRLDQTPSDVASLFERNSVVEILSGQFHVEVFNQVGSQNREEEFFDAEENLEKGHEPMEVDLVEQSGVSKQTGRKRPSTEEQEKSEVKKLKLSPQKEKIKERLNTFMKAFVTDFSKELAISHIRAKGKQVTLEKVIEELKIGATGALIGYGIARGMTGIIPSISASARNIVGQFIHIGKTKAARITRIFESVPKGYLSQILSEAAAEIFCSFESQFMSVTDNAGDKMAIEKLAEDAVYRALNYIAKNSEAISSDFIAKSIILGKSEGILKRGYALKDKSGKDLNTGGLYKETGVIVSEGKVNRYYSNNRGKYGYRLPLAFEKENGIRHLLALLERRELQEDQHTQEINYTYVLQSGDIKKESNEILKEIEKAEPLTKSDIEAITGILAESAKKLQTPQDIKFIPKELVENFTGREKELEDLDRLLNPNSDSSDIAVIQEMALLSINSQASNSLRSSNSQASLSGLGGIGKTQLALKYAEEYSEYYNNNVIWIDAETQSEILNSVRKLLNLGELGEFRRNLNINSLSEIDSNVTERNIEVIIQEIYKYFKETKILFIFDNVKNYDQIKEYLPKQFVGNKPSILITSRYRNWENTKVKVLDLNVFTDEEAEKFIRNALEIESDDSSQDKDIENLASKLQRLPLALAQAVAYIKIEGLGIQEYLEKYKTEAQKLLDSKHFQEFFHDPYIKTVFTTWKVTLSKIEKDKEAGKEAIEILNIMAYFAPENINRVIFLNFAWGDEDRVKSATRLLLKYSMVNSEQKQSILNIHRLVQKVARLELEGQGEEKETMVKAFELLKKDFPYGSDTQGDIAKKRQLLPHLEVLLSHLDDWLVKKPEDKQRIEENYLEGLLIWVSDGYSDLGNPIRKKELLERALGAFEKHYGSENVEVARILVNLGNAYGDLGNTQKQKELLECALGIFEKHYGTENFEVARVLVNLGNAYGDLVDPQKKKVLLERALKIFEKHYGPEYFEVAKILINLGNAYGDLGNPQKKKELLERALEIQQKHYSSEHFEVAKVLGNLGNAYGDLGDPQKKKELLEQALEIYKKHYGSEYFEVAKLLVSLGNAYGNLGNTQKKKELLERALGIFEKHYGPEHFEVAKVLTNLGNAYGDLGDSQKQKELLARALPIQENYLATALENLGNTYGNLGDPQKKKELLERALGIFEKHYGPEHFEVARTLVNLGNAYGDLGDPKKQKKLLERALEIFEEHYGHEHFEVARILVNLGNAYGDLGDPQKQKELLERALEIFEGHYGPEHFEVAKVLTNLGNAYGDLGDFQKQKMLLERALVIKEKHYGPGHFEATKVLTNLGNAYGDLGNPQKQKMLLEWALEIQEKYYGPGHFEVARTLVNLGNAYGDLGDPQKQKELLEQRALGIFEKHYGHEHFEVAKILTNLGNAYGDLGDNKKKKELLERALAIEEKHYGLEHFEVARTLVNLGHAYGNLGDPQKQKELLERALAIEEKHYGSEHFEVAKLLINLSNAYMDLGDPQKKKELLERALPIFERYNHHFVTELRRMLDELVSRTPLHLAASSGNLDTVKNLIEKGADIFVGSSHDTILHQSVGSGNEEVIRLILEKIKEKEPQKMFEHINARDTEGETPLMWAAEKGKVSAARILLEYGANTNAIDNYDQTALHFATEGGYLKLVQLLLSKQANFNIQDKNGKTPLDLAQEKLVQDPEDDNLKIIASLLLSVTNESKSKKQEEQGSVSLEECLPGPSSDARGSDRRKRETKECELSWDDVDEFNDEEEEIRDFSKIKINSDKFIDYIKSELMSETKLAQLVQLASKVQVTEGLVNKLINNQKVMNHLNKVGRISDIAMHGMMAKNVLADFLSGDYQGVAINLGFIAGGQGFARVAQAASVKGTGLVLDGKLFLGRSLKAASPFLARGTSAFVVYDLVNQIKEYKKGNKDALVGIVGDSIYLGVDSTEVGIEIAEAFEIFEGVSSVTGPIGAAIGAVVFVGTDVYLAIKRVDRIDEIIHLTGSEKFIEGLRAFIGMKPEGYIEELMEEKEVNNQLVTQGLEYLKQHSDIQKYVFPTGKSVIDSCHTTPYQTSICVSGGIGGKCFKTRTVTRLARECTTKFQVDLDNTVLLDRTRTDIKWNRSKPDNLNGGELFCLPKGDYESVPNNGAYSCENAIGIADLSTNKTGNYTLINLGEGVDYVKGFIDSPNIFLVGEGFKRLHGGNKNDIFVLQGDLIKGFLSGEGGVDTLDFRGFGAKNNEYALIDIKGSVCSRNDEYAESYECTHGLKTSYINQIYGRKSKADRVHFVKDLEYVDGLGGENSNKQDYVKIPYDLNKNPKVVLRSYTKVFLLEGNNRSIDFIDYIIPRGEHGESSVSFSFKGLIQHRFGFDYSLSNLREINIGEDDITFNFFDKLKECNIILINYYDNSRRNYPDFPVNTSYTFQDNTEIKILNRNNFYAQQRANKTVEEIISDYPAVANRLNMTMLFQLSNDETVMIGHGAHEVMHNNPSFTSHLVGNGGENVYVVAPGQSFDKLPISEVVIYDVDTENSTDTIDLRKVVQQAKRECPESQVSHKINKDNNDLIIKLYSNRYFSSGSCINLSSEFLISSVILKGALLNEWYKKLHVVLNSAPMKIKGDGHLWNLESLPLLFDKDKEIIVIIPDDVEKDTELVTEREAGNYIFARTEDDLIITNVFNQEESERCTILLKDFYQEAKMQTLSVKFADKEIILKDHQEQISAARDIDVVKKEHKDQVYNNVFNHTRSENISSEVNETTTHEIRHKHSRHKHQNTTEHQRSRRAIKEAPIIGSSDDLEFFVAQNNATPVMGNDRTSSAATRIGSGINDLFGWVKNSIGGLFNSRAALHENNTTQSSLSQVDAQVNVDGTILLLDVFIRKITGQEHVSTEGQSISLLEAQANTLNITTKFEQILNETAVKSGISATSLNFNPVSVQSTIVGQIRNGNFSEISKTLYSAAKEACRPEFKQTDKFLAQLRSHLEGVLAEKEVELLVGKQKSLSKANRLVEKSVPQAEVDNKPNTFLNDTLTSKQLSYVERVRGESSGLKSYFYP
ncbi:tetratricopeptide repeat protein [Wolbachia endosymbiont of Folsomia candida]|uniref:tetratricopeptide repeat protein n=1 Tax=Wolbachia endosymbiont of Folsomia candida TaxID=169402 RepID=UPI001F1A9945|nr:tetratricopeptide repeat protein [Wolbachia endosymbiont of Folsomia candida]